MHYQSLDALVDKHPSTCTISANLGETLMYAYFHTRESRYLDEGITAFRTAVNCETAPAFQRFSAARLWAHHADFNHESALDAYRAAIEILPRLAMFGLDVQTRQQALTYGSDGLARDAAACAIRSGQYVKAIELLEAGRAVFWSQALQLRTPMADLQVVAPELATELKCIASALERGSFRDMSEDMTDTPQKVMLMEKEASHLNHLNDMWLATLEKARQLDGFQDFLRPSRLSTLQCAAINGLVVILNASESGCDALIMTLTGVEHIPLPELSLTDAHMLVKLTQTATGSKGRYPEAVGTDIDALVQQRPALQSLKSSDEARHVGRASNAPMPEYILRRVLAVIWVSVAEPVICSLKLEVNRNWF
jgi:hypothetical protein